MAYLLILTFKVLMYSLSTAFKIQFLRAVLILWYQLYSILFILEDPE